MANNNYTQNFIDEVKGALNRGSSSEIDVESDQRLVIRDKDGDVMEMEEVTDTEIDNIIEGTFTE